MLNPREVQDAIDDVLGNKKDPLRLTRDFLKQVGDHTDRVHRLEKKLDALKWEKDRCGGNWASALSVLEKIATLTYILVKMRMLIILSTFEDFSTQQRLLAQKL